MRTVFKVIGLGAAAVLLAAECALIPSEADALTSHPAGSPPVTSVPGPFYNQGDPINLCVNQRTEQVRAEVHTNVLGNCAAGEVQLTVTADPDALATPAPTPTATG
jgi:hypothetical protein